MSMAPEDGIGAHLAPPPPKPHQVLRAAWEYTIGEKASARFVRVQAAIVTWGAKFTVSLMDFGVIAAAVLSDGRVRLSGLVDMLHVQALGGRLPQDFSLTSSRRGTILYLSGLGSTRTQRSLRPGRHFPPLRNVISSEHRRAAVAKNQFF